MENFIRSYQAGDTGFCDEIVEWYKANKNTMGLPGITADADGNVGICKEAKDSVDISLSIEQAYTYSCITKGLEHLWNSVINYVTVQFPVLSNSNFYMPENLAVQGYEPGGGFHMRHCERLCQLTQSRMLVWMLYLNTVEDEGGTRFVHYDHVEKAEKGKLLIWPPDFTHVHHGVASPSEEKFIMTGWYNWKD